MLEELFEVVMKSEENTGEEMVRDECYRERAAEGGHPPRPWEVGSAGFFIEFPVRQPAEVVW